MNFPWLSKAVGRPVPLAPTDRDMFLSRFYDLEKNAPMPRMRTQMGRGARKLLRQLRAEGIIAPRDTARDMIVLTQDGAEVARRSAARVRSLSEARKQFDTDLRAHFVKPEEESAPELS